MPHMLKIGTRSFLGTQLRYQMSIHGCILTHMKKLGLKIQFLGINDFKLHTTADLC